MDWINGRSLKNYMDTNKNLNISYRYNKDGIREEKSVNGIVTKYHLENSSTIYEQRGNDTIYYLYDLTGLVGLKYHDNTYYYLKNLQGDIIGILDQDYNQIVTYEYDSWGKLLSIKDENQNEIKEETHIGIINSLRYRGYYYDTETDLYYLNSRYYNPTWYRFLNADGILGANQDILGYNLYTYVSNSPVVLIDLDGRVAAAVGALLGATIAKIAAKEAKQVVKNIASTVGKNIKNTLDYIVSVNVTASDSKERLVGLLDTGITYGTTTSVSKPIIGSENSIIKINVGDSKGIEVDIGNKSASLNFSSNSVDFSFKNKNGVTSNNFDFGMHGFSLYAGVSTTTNLGDGLDETLYGRFNINMAIPALAYIGIHYGMPAIGISPAIPSFPAIPIGT